MNMGSGADPKDPLNPAKLAGSVRPRVTYNRLCRKCNFGALGAELRLCKYQLESICNKEAQEDEYTD